MRPRLLWTTIPEKLPIRPPTCIFTDLRRDVGRALLEAHPSLQGVDRGGALGQDLGGVDVVTWAEDQPPGGRAFQQPGEGPWMIYPPAFRVPMREGIGGSSRISNVVRSAKEVARELRERNRAAVVWQLSDNGFGSGLLGIGAALALGRAVVVSTGAPDALSLTAATTHGVEIQAEYNAGDALAMIARVAGY